MNSSLVPIALPQRPPLPEGATVLAVDTGGTKTDFGLFTSVGGSLRLQRAARYPSRQMGSLTVGIRQFLGDSPVPHRLVLAFAGPVQEGRAHATNLGWNIDTRELCTSTGVPEAWLINDLEASAYGLAALQPAELLKIYSGDDTPVGNAAIIAPGTGLGEAGLYWDGRALHPFATEGGHTDFALRNAQDWELFQFLEQRFGHVSWERLLSGPGIENIFHFLREVKGREMPASLEQQLPGRSLAEAIGMAAREDCPVCSEVLRLFVRYLAVEASDLALKFNATGGVFIGGGIAPKIWNADLQAVFLEHFFQVGRLRHLLETMPVSVVLNPKTALLGAALYGGGEKSYLWPAEPGTIARVE